MWCNATQRKCKKTPSHVLLQSACAAVRALRFDCASSVCWEMWPVTPFRVGVSARGHVTLPNALRWTPNPKETRFLVATARLALHLGTVTLQRNTLITVLDTSRDFALLLALQGRISFHWRWKHRSEKNKWRKKVTAWSRGTGTRVLEHSLTPVDQVLSCCYLPEEWSLIRKATLSRRSSVHSSLT